MLREVLRKIDLILRFLDVALVPAILAVFAQFVSVLGLVLATGVATAIALLGTERWRTRVGHPPIIGRFLGTMARLGEYATTPPRPLVYYILYPCCSRTGRSRGARARSSC